MSEKDSWSPLSCHDALVHVRCPTAASSHHDRFVQLSRCCPVAAAVVAIAAIPAAAAPSSYGHPMLPPPIPPECLPRVPQAGPRLRLPRSASRPQPAGFGERVVLEEQGAGARAARAEGAPRAGPVEPPEALGVPGGVGRPTGLCGVQPRAALHGHVPPLHAATIPPCVRDHQVRSRFSSSGFIHTDSCPRVPRCVVTSRRSLPRAALPITELSNIDFFCFDSGRGIRVAYTSM